MPPKEVPPTAKANQEVTHSEQHWWMYFFSCDMLIEALNKVDAASVKTEVKGSKHNRTSQSLHHYFHAHAPFKHYSTPRDRKEKKHQWRKLPGPSKNLRQMLRAQFWWSKPKSILHSFSNTYLYQGFKRSNKSCTGSHHWHQKRCYSDEGEALNYIKSKSVQKLTSSSRPSTISSNHVYSGRRRIYKKGVQGPRSRDSQG